MPKFEKGHKKVGGRTAGTKNKKPSEARNKILEIVYDNVDEARHKLSLISDPKDWLMMYCRLMEHSLPKVTAVLSNTDASDLATEIDKLEKGEI